MSQRRVVRTVERPSLPVKLTLVLRALYWSTVVRSELRRRPLPRVVDRLRPVDRVRPYRISSGRLGRGVARVLRIGPFEARCLVTALVLYRLLREQGDDPELVIGLEPSPRSRDAHAWLEIDGRDVGPPPGRGVHEGVLRYR